MRSFKTVWLLPFLLILVLSACRKPTSANWDVDLVLPVLNSKLNISNFAGDTLFTADNNGILHFKLNREIASLKLDSVLKLPDTLITSSYVNVFPFVLTHTNNLAFFAPTEIKFDVANGAAIKNIDIQKASLKVSFSNDLTEPLDMIYRINSATKNGTVFTIRETIPPGQNSLLKTYDLSGYHLDMRGISGLIYNTIVQSYTILLSPGANTVNVPSGKGAKVQLGFSEAIPQYAEGYFGQQLIEIKADTASFGVTDNFKADNFMLSDANMKFYLLNEFGAEFSASLSNIKSLNTSRNSSVTLNSNQLSNLNINRGGKSGTQLYPSIKTIEFNKTNSNITSFISNLPDKLVYEGKVNVNPLGNTSGYNDFAFYNTGIKLVADIDIPLVFTANKFELKTTESIDFSGVTELEKLNDGRFVISASNGYPFDARIQAYLVNEIDQIIDSLFINNDNIILRASLNSNNVVIKPTYSNLYVPVNKLKIEHLKQAKRVQVITTIIVPTGPSDVSLRENYELNLGIVAELNYNISRN